MLYGEKSQSNTTPLLDINSISCEVLPDKDKILKVYNELLQSKDYALKELKKLEGNTGAITEKFREQYKIIIAEVDNIIRDYKSQIANIKQQSQKEIAEQQKAPSHQLRL